MRTSIALLSVLAVSMLAAGVADGQTRASPHEQVSGVVGARKVTINYGRPSKKGRAIFGALVPYDQVWRTGANEATTLETDGDLMVGTLLVPKGTYTLFTIPAEKGWTLIVNKEAKQWGAYRYDQTKDLGRTPMTVTASPAVQEQLTIAIATDQKPAQLRIAWDKTVATVPLKAP